MRTFYYKTTIFLTAGLLVALMSSVAQARPPYATTTGNSCSSCHTDEPGHLTVNGDDLVTLPGDPNGRGEIPIFLNNLPGDTVALNMHTDDGDQRFAVQLKRFEKSEVYGGPAMPQDMAGWAADNLNWTLQDEVWGFGGPTGTPWDTPYFTSVEFVPENWADVSHPDPKTFDLHIPDATLPGFYDFEYAVGGGPGMWYGDQHFYVEVVPEPSSTILLGLGCIGIAFGAWRRRRRAV